jgi:methyl-accepting chemotaxis protein
VQRAASGTNQVSQNITSVTTATTQTGEVAQVVLQSSEKLAGKLQVLQREVSEFVTGLRAA